MTTLALDGAPATSSAGAGKWAIAIAVSLGALLEIVDMSIVNVALPQMQASLGATLAQVSWVITSYGIANVIILPLAAWLGHRFGHAEPEHANVGWQRAVAALELVDERRESILLRHGLS